jgi:hypothetical protein
MQEIFLQKERLSIENETYKIGVHSIFMWAIKQKKKKKR